VEFERTAAVSEVVWGLCSRPAKGVRHRRSRGKVERRCCGGSVREMGGKHGGGEKNGRRKSACVECKRATEKDRVEV
jgi:hypothetical protein